MAPKKAKKISLNEFLVDSTLGSWADEMDSLPSAPAMRTDEDQGRGGDRFGRRGDDFLSSRPDRVAGPPREDLPLPTSPPYTAFVGNLAFDLSEADLEDFFATSKPKSVKIIRDREDKPKGFGYVEFEDLDGLKDALGKSNSSFSGRTIRVSVAEAPKERSGGFGGDDTKFDSPWRRDGPLPDRASRDGERRGPRPDREPPLPSVAEGASDWRSSKPRAPVEPELPPSGSRRKNIGFGSENTGAADREDTWAKGSKFQPSTDEEQGPGSRFGGGRRQDGPPRGPPPPTAATEDTDWRSARRPTRDNTSPNNSTPPTPQMGRRKLELLPRSGSGSNVPSPLSSPKIGPTPSASGPPRSNPFGAAKPVDVTSREKEVTERVDKDRERMSMSRTSSRTGMERTTSRSGMERTTSRPGMERTSSRPGNERPPITRNQSNPTSPISPTSGAPKTINPALAANIRPSFSFANAAARQKNEAGEDDGAIPNVDDVRDKLGEVTI